MDEGAVLGGLLEAAHFAARKHRDQRRKDAHQSPYINHPIGVAYLLWKEGGVTDLATLQVRRGRAGRHRDRDGAWMLPCRLLCCTTPLKTLPPARERLRSCLERR